MLGLGLQAAPSLCWGGVGFILRSGVCHAQPPGDLPIEDQTCVSCPRLAGQNSSPLHHQEASEFKGQVQTVANQGSWTEGRN